MTLSDAPDDTLPTDIFFDVKAHVPANAWAGHVVLSRRVGAQPVNSRSPTMVDDEPMLMPANNSDFGEMSCGAEKQPIPNIDNQKNTTLSNGAELVLAAPSISSDTRGRFLLWFDPRIESTRAHNGELGEQCTHPISDQICGYPTVDDRDGTITIVDSAYDVRGSPFSGVI